MAAFEVVASTAAHALAHLSAIATSGTDDAELAGALDRIGDPTGETWSHLNGWCAPPHTDGSVAEFQAALHEADPRQFRSTLLGTTAWSWVNVAGKDVLDAAVDGDPTAARELLANPRYYAGRAADALPTVLAFDADETQAAFAAAFDRYVAVHAEDLDVAERHLATVGERIAERFAAEDPVDTIADLTGYRWFPEPEADRVVLIVHGHDRSLTLAQHNGARLIVHGEPAAATSGLVEMAAALADETRATLLAHIAAEGPVGLAPLVARAQVSRSTVHHHLGILRQAGLVTVEGNARSYRYRIPADAARRWSAAFPTPEEDR